MSLAGDLLHWLEGILGSRSFSESRQNRAMLDQYYATLRVGLQTCSEGEDTRPHLFRSAEELLSAEGRQRSWVDANKAEMLLAEIRPASRLLQEILGAQRSLRSLGRSDQTPYDGEIAEIAARPADRPLAEPEAEHARGLLARMLAEVHWKRAERHQKRLLNLAYAVRLFYYLLVTLVLHALTIRFTHGRVGLDEDDLTLFPYAGLLLAGATGLVGAVFSMMTGQKQSVVDLSIEAAQAATSNKMILLRLGIGLIGAFVLYSAFESHLVEGALFPDLESIGFSEIKLQAGPSGPVAAHLGFSVPNEDLSKLLIWSFIAGFSEKLVPGMLNRVEASARGSGGQ